MAEVKVIPIPDGPYMVQGPIKLVDSEGKEFGVEGATMYLCRCGGSSNKPFCDGSHKKIAFRAPTLAA